ncbi:hypothetical protein [Polluticaenibacter yanchengensis]|uniref:Terminase n=1 Tax=Polluticaenibacter yanchengensis TaxID=3014562 RepID=A0ABT4UIQ3_9BACT|nr:hypothetical protein [Chitinophagaceae bacterium LY-5]
MYKKFKGGSFEQIYKYKCHIPPIGYGFHTDTGELEPVDVIKSSNIPSEQDWVRTPLPEWYIEKRESEEFIQESDPTYIDNDCEQYRQQEWHRRLHGVWVYLSGKPVYITGMHYMYLQWWVIDSGDYPDFRRADRWFFYVLALCILDPNCLGLIEVTKRKQGKTARSGLFMYEYISRTSYTHGGIQSKTDGDAEEVMMKAIIMPWTKLPHFFRPVYDTTGGDIPKKSLRFFNASRRGKSTMSSRGNIGRHALNSWIDFDSSKPGAYDGPKLQRKLDDEAGKLADHSIYERHNISRFCCEIDGIFIGKMLYTTTVEEFEKGGENFQKLWYESQYEDRLKTGTGRTKTGLYDYFLPAYETMYLDKYGTPDIKKAKEWYEKQFKAQKGEGLTSFRRKNPLTIEHAFYVDGTKSQFNADLCNEQLEVLQPLEGSLYESGNFMWKNNVRFSEVIWVKNKNGKFHRTWFFPEGGKPNNVIKKGSSYSPNNKVQFVAGCDPFSHSIVLDEGRKSMGCAFVKMKYHPSMIGDDFEEAIVCRYHARPKTTGMFHEDMLMMAWFYGCEILFENNKNGWDDYFTSAGCRSFLMMFNGTTPGINGNNTTAELICDEIEAYLENHVKRIRYPTILKQALKFEFHHRTPYDEIMALGYTLIADSKRKYQEEAKQKVDLGTIFRFRKV